MANIPTNMRNSIKRKKLLKGNLTCGQQEASSSTTSLPKPNSLVPIHGDVIQKHIKLVKMMQFLAMMIEDHYEAPRSNSTPKKRLKKTATIFYTRASKGAPVFVIDLSFENEQSKNEGVFLLSSECLGKMLPTQFSEIRKISTKEGNIFFYTTQMFDSSIHLTLQSSMETLANRMQKQRAIESSFVESNLMLKKNTNDIKSEEALVRLLFLKKINFLNVDEQIHFELLLSFFKDLVDKSGVTLLFKAIRASYLVAVTLLLEKGFKINSINTAGETPLHLAALGNQLFSCPGSENRYLQIVELLLSKGADVHSVDNSKETSLHKATRADNVSVVRHLLSKGANIHSFNLNGETPLHLATRGSSYQLVETLIEHRANVFVFDKKGYTPLHDSVMKNNLSLVKLLLKDKSIVKATDFQYMTPLHHAALRNLKDISFELVKNQPSLNFPDNQGRTPLHIACNENNIEIVKCFVKNGANVNFRDLSGDTPLSLAAEKGHYETVEYLLQAKADVNYPNKIFETPLHKATRKDRRSVIKCLLENNAKIDFPNKRNSTPLHVALKEDNIELAKFLINEGANVNLEDKFQVSALFIYIEKGLSKIDKDGELHKLMKYKGAVSRNEYFIRRRERCGPEKLTKMADKLWQKIQKTKNSCAAF